MGSGSAREAFWDWWIGSEEALTADVSEEGAPPAGILGRFFRRMRGDPGRGLAAALADVDEALELVHPGIHADYGPSGWAFTSLAYRAVHREVVRLIRACPPDVADRPAAGVPRWRRPAVTVGGVTFSRNRFRWVTVLRDRGLILGVVVSPPEGATPARIHQAAGRLVVSELGEDTALRLQEWRVIPSDSRSAASARPWDDLLPRITELLDGTEPPLLDLGP